MKPLIWVIIIFFCAAIFRLTNMDLIEFKLDEARDVYEMEKFFSEPYFIQRGTIQSTGVYNPPLWYYILAVLSLPSRDPQYLSFMIGLINCVAVAGFYWVVQRFYGQWVGVVAGLFMAFSPWMIIFSRKIWAPDLILPLLVPLFYFLHKKNAFWVVLLLSLLAQLHASGIFLAVGTICALAIVHLGGISLDFARDKKAHLGGVLLGLILGLIPLLPYIAYQFQTGCEDCQAYFTYQSGEAITAEPFFDSNAFIRPFQLINGSGFEDALGAEGLDQFLENYPIIKAFNMFFLLEFLLLPLGVFFLVKFINTTIVSRMNVLGVAGMVCVLVFITKTAAHLYYFLIVSPIVILIYSFGAVGLEKKIGRIGLISLIGFILLLNIAFEFSFYKYLGEIKIIPGDYGQIYSLLKEQAQEKVMKVEEFVISLYNNY